MATPTPVPSAAPSATALASPSPAVATLPPISCPAPPTYNVVAGDTLSGIADHFQVTLEQLLLANPQIRDPRLIHVGDRVTISPIALGTLGGQRSDVAAINDRGQIVGESQTASGESHAFLWQDGVMTDLGTLGGPHSEAAAINERGQVVGTSDDHAFLWQDGVMTDLGGTPICDETGCYAQSAAAAVNDAGQVAGQSGDQPRAALWDDGTWTDLGALPRCTGDGCVTAGTMDSGVVAINERGQVVGWSASPRHATNASGRAHAVLWQNGTVTDLGAFNDDYSTAVGINEAGQIVGVSNTVVTCDLCGGQKQHAVLWQDGRMIDLGTLGGDFSRAVAINDRGQILGFSAMPGNRVEHPFLWQDGRMTDLAPLVGPGIGPVAINDCGDIVGQNDDVFPENAYLWPGVVASNEPTASPSR